VTAAPAMDSSHVAGFTLRRATEADAASITALQRAAYAPNRTILGVEPLPLLADYADIVRDKEAWLAEAGSGPVGLLVLEEKPDELHVWNVSVMPSAQGRGLGNRLLAAAEDRARELGRSRLTLVTGEKLTRNVAWYRRHGYVVEQVEAMPDRRAVHMSKTL
jgi:ribosomal protein S18 acetylase RimI-like enzyme